MTYKISITTGAETISQDFTNLDEVYQVINALGNFYGENQFVPISNEPFVAVKYKDITKLVVTGVSRSQLLKYAQAKREQEQAEKMAADQSQMAAGSIGQNANLATGLCESSGSRLI